MESQDVEYRNNEHPKLRHERGGSVPTGPKHQLIGSGPRGAIPPNQDCRCTIGEDHFDDGELLSSQEDSGDSYSVHDAADAWLSNGMDEDYMFGYSEAELRRAAGL